MIVSFLGLKGGQGKSTLAVRLGAWLAAASHRTVVVDLSPAGSASALLGHGHVADSGSGELLGGLVTPAQACRETDCPRLSVVPLDGALAGMPPASEAVRNLRALARGQDFVLLDAPSGWGGGALLALLAADWAILPAMPGELGLLGALRSLEWMREAGARRRRRARLAGIVLNQVQPRTRRSADFEARFRSELGQEVLRTTVRRDASFARGDSLARTWKRPRQPTGGDRDLVALRRELLKLMVRRS